MELREVIGRRRSIRFLLPYKPVEPEKIQRMLEAARIASHWGNVQSLRALAVFRDSAPPATLEALPAPVAGVSFAAGALLPWAAQHVMGLAGNGGLRRRLQQLLSAEHPELDFRDAVFVGSRRANGSMCGTVRRAGM
jgi:nitroreductase